MKLRDKQSLFASLVPLLILKALQLGYEVTLGELQRPMDAADGHPRSTHKFKLAIHLNLFRDGKYLRKTDDHEPLGIWWEQQHELCRWGGRFSDGNHYSLEHGGVR